MRRVWQGNSNFTQYRRRTFLDLITKVMGIVNGTTNFILTKMSDEGRAYNDVLKEAQQLDLQKQIQHQM